MLFAQAASGRTTHLDGLEMPIARDAAADVEDQLAQGHAHRHLDEAGVVQLAGQGEDLGARAVLGPHRPVPLGPVDDDQRDVGPGLDVVDVGRFAPQAGDRRVGRPRARHAPAALDRGDQRRLLAADERAGAFFHLEVEAEPAAEDVVAQQPPLLGLVQSDAEILDGAGVLRAAVDVPLVGAHCVGADQHALDHGVSVALQEPAVHERPGVAFVGVADHVLLIAVLCGRGGGGVPAGREWGLAAAQDGDKKYVICNADEGDPGAFMDRGLLEGDTHAVVEGMLIGAYAMGADEGYVYCRAEYPGAIKNLGIALNQAEERGLLGDDILGSGFSFHLQVKEGAGAFVCGEETALIASIEGRRGMPRARPPYPAVAGLWGKPTNINNVETWANVPLIIVNGADWYRTIGTENSPGTKVFSLAGKLNNTGLVEVPMGMTLRELI